MFELSKSCLDNLSWYPLVALLVDLYKSALTPYCNAIANYIDYSNSLSYVKLIPGLMYYAVPGWAFWL